MILGDTVVCLANVVVLNAAVAADAARGVVAVFCFICSGCFAAAALPYRNNIVSNTDDDKYDISNNDAEDNNNDDGGKSNNEMMKRMIV